MSKNVKMKNVSDGFHKCQEMTKRHTEWRNSQTTEHVSSRFKKLLGPDSVDECNISPSL